MTSTGTLEVQDSDRENQITGSLMLLSVNLQDQDIRKYYMNVARKPHTEVKNIEGDDADSDMEIDNNNVMNKTITMMVVKTRMKRRHSRLLKSAKWYLKI